MKPCADKKKFVAWLALNTLDASAAQELQAHLQSCAGCRQYHAELSQVTAQLAVVPPAPDMQTSESFHRQVMIRIKAEPSVSRGETIMASLRTTIFNWHVAVPVCALVLLLTIIPWPFAPGGVQPAAPKNIPVVMAAATVEPAPTIANYQQAASQSMDKLDAMLLEEGKPKDNPLHVYTASAMSLNF